MNHRGIINCGRWWVPWWRLLNFISNGCGGIQIFFQLAHIVYFSHFQAVRPQSLLFFHTVPGKTRLAQEVMCFWLPVGCGTMAVFALNKWIEQGKGRIEASYICALLESSAGSTSAAPRCEGGEGKEDRWPQSGDDGGCDRPFNGQRTIYRRFTSPHTAW